VNPTIDIPDHTTTFALPDRDALVTAAAVLQHCEEAVTGCASAVFDEPEPIEQLSEVCRDMDCADVLAVTRRVLTRRADPDPDLLRAQLAACLVALRLSHELCSSHAEEYPQARTCSNATVRGIEVCRRLLDELRP
jgi:hypothetical protein